MFGCGDTHLGRILENAESDRMRVWAEELFNSNQIAADTLAGSMKFLNKMVMLKKRNKIWNYAVQPERCNGLA